MYDRHPAIAALIYVLTCVALISLMPILAMIGFEIEGFVGAAIGFIIAWIIIMWAGIWYISN